MRNIVKTAFAALILLVPSVTWAWGCTGHEVVALIARDQMNAAIRTKLDHALASIPRGYAGRYCTDLDLPNIAYFSTWADDYRTLHKETAQWHYWNIPLEQTRASVGQYCDDGCVVSAIFEQTKNLKDTTKSQEERLHALLFLIHFVGDIHQPLHAEDNLDRGGNCVPIDFLEKHSQPRSQDNHPTANYSPNLHGIWDTDLVEYVGQIKTRNKDSVEGFAERLNHRFAPRMAGWKKQPDPVPWALESHRIAREKAYRLLPVPIAPVHYTRALKDCGDDNTSYRYSLEHEAADRRYIDAVGNDVQVQLASAGAKLAALLEGNWPKDWN